MRLHLGAQLLPLHLQTSPVPPLCLQCHLLSWGPMHFLLWPDWVQTCSPLLLSHFLNQMLT